MTVEKKPKESKLMKVLCRIAARYYLHRPDQAELIYIKHPGLSELWPAVANEACYRLGLGKSYKMTSLNIELTNRCNLSCGHCPKTLSDSRAPRDMDFETFRRIVDSVPSVENILPFQWGEPLLNTAVYDCIAYAAKCSKRVMLTTNGTLLTDDASEKFIESGLSRLTVSFDGDRKTHAELRRVDPAQVIANIVRFKEIRDKRSSSCALDVSMVVNERTEPLMDSFAALFEGIADRIQYIPGFVKDKRESPCRELWRGLLVVLSNGDVTICCVDLNGDAVIGNVLDSPPGELFNSRAMRLLRKRHVARDFPAPCRSCAEYASSRVSPRFS